MVTTTTAVDLNPTGSRHNQRWAFVVLLALFILLAGVYSVITPTFESPDEVWHYAFVQYLAQGNALPVLTLDQPGPWAQEGGQPPLYYWLASLVTRWLPASDWQTVLVPNLHADIGTYYPDGNGQAFIHTPADAWPYRGAVLAIHLARLVSILLSAGTVLGTFLIGRMVWPARPQLALAGAALLAFNPMFLFISASVSNDNLVTLLCTAALYLMLRLLQEPPSYMRWVALGMVIGLAALSKISALALIVPAGLVLLRIACQKRNIRSFLLEGVSLALPVAAIAGWWYLRNWQLYGDPLALNVFVATIGPRLPQVTFWQLTGEWQGLVRSFWGVFGWMNVVAPGWFYWLLGGLVLLGLAGGMVQLGRWLIRKDWPPVKRLAQGGLLVIWQLVVFASLVRWTLITPATQGRLLFPAATALMLLLAYGLSRLVPPKQGILPLAGAVMLAGLAIWAPFGVIRPAYAPPRPITDEEQAVIPNPTLVSFEQRFAILGFQLSPQTVAPGGEIAVTIYWQAQAKEQQTLSVFVQLVDAAGELVANRNVLLGSASLTTPYWAPGMVIKQTYLLHVSPLALNPSQADLKVGIFQRYDDQRRLQAVDAAGTSLGDAALLAAVKVAAPGQDDIRNVVNYRLENGINLVGYNLSGDMLRPGEIIHVTLFWRLQQPVTSDYAIFTQVMDTENRVWGQFHAHLPGSGGASTSTWPVGEVIREDYEFTLAPEAPSGVYALDIGMYLPETGVNLRWLQQDGSAGDNHLILTRLRVAAP